MIQVSYAWLGFVCVLLLVTGAVVALGLRESRAPQEPVQAPLRPDLEVPGYLPRYLAVVGSADVEEWIQPERPHYPRVRLIHDASSEVDSIQV